MLVLLALLLLTLLLLLLILQMMLLLLLTLPLLVMLAVAASVVGIVTAAASELLFLLLVLLLMLLLLMEESCSAAFGADATAATSWCMLNCAVAAASVLLLPLLQLLVLLLLLLLLLLLVLLLLPVSMPYGCPTHLPPNPRVSWDLLQPLRFHRQQLLDQPTESRCAITSIFTDDASALTGLVMQNMVHYTEPLVTAIVIAIRMKKPCNSHSHNNSPMGGRMSRFGYVDGDSINAKNVQHSISDNGRT